MVMLDGDGDILIWNAAKGTNSVVVVVTSIRRWCTDLASGVGGAAATRFATATEVAVVVATIRVTVTRRWLLGTLRRRLCATADGFGANVGVDYGRGFDHRWRRRAGKWLLEGILLSSHPII